MDSYTGSRAESPDSLFGSRHLNEGNLTAVFVPLCVEEDTEPSTLSDITFGERTDAERDMNGGAVEKFHRSDFRTRSNRLNENDPTPQ